MTIAITICVIAVGLLFLPFLSPGDSVFLQNIGNISYPLHSLVFLEEHPNEVLWYTFAFASEEGDTDEENGDEENGDEENGDEENGDEENGDEENGDGGNGDTGDLGTRHIGNTGDLPNVSLAPNSGGSGTVPSEPAPGIPPDSAFPDDLSGSAPWSGNTEDPSPSGTTTDLGANSAGSAGDFGDSTKLTSRTFVHNAQKIAIELSGKTPLQISQYPINALSTVDLRLVFGFLDPVNLAKVLLNISLQDLQTIQMRLSGDNSFANILSRLSLPDRSEVERRLSIVQ